MSKQIGDTVVQYGPGHAALPWAGVRFILQVAVGDIVKFDFVVEGAESISRMIGRYAIFEDTYLRRTSKASMELEMRSFGCTRRYLCINGKLEASSIRARRNAYSGVSSSRKTNLQVLPEKWTLSSPTWIIALLSWMQRIKAISATLSRHSQSVIPRGMHSLWSSSVP